MKNKSTKGGGCVGKVWVSVGVLFCLGALGCTTVHDIEAVPGQKDYYLLAETKTSLFFTTHRVSLYKLGPERLEFIRRVR